MVFMCLASLSRGAPSHTSYDDVIRSKNVNSLIALKRKENFEKKNVLKEINEKSKEGDDKEVTNLFNLIQEINRFSNLIENDKTDDAMESTEEEDLNKKSILSPKNALDVAEYVLKSGDENSIVEILEKLLEEGKVSEEDTLTFLENIKMYMEEAKLYLELVENLQNSLKEDTFIDLEQMEEGKTEANKDIQTIETERNQSLKSMNEFLDSSFKNNKISEDVFIQLKGTLLKASLEDMKKIQKKF